MNKYPFSAFDYSLRQMRFLREHWGGVVSRAERDGFISPAGTPRILESGDLSNLIEVSSFYKPPTDQDFRALENYLGQPVPSDFRAFYQRYSEALVVTRSKPIHIFSLSHVMEFFQYYSHEPDRSPRRFFRFAGVLSTDCEYYGLRQKVCGGDEWEVTTAALQADEFLEGGTDHDEWRSYFDEPLPDVIAPSFHSWLEHLVITDGMEDPYNGDPYRKPEGPFYPYYDLV